MRTRAPLLLLVLLTAACSSGEPSAQSTPEPPAQSTQAPAVRSPRAHTESTKRPTSSPVTPGASSVEAKEPKIEGVAGPPGGSDAATRLRAEPECGLGNEAVVHLSWRPARDPGRSQIIVVTVFSNGFETGNYQTSPDLAAEASKFDWTETTANGAYRWRVMTRRGDTWVPSEVSSFIGPSCGVEDTG